MVTVQFDERLLSNRIKDEWIARKEGKFIFLELESGRSVGVIIQAKDLQFSQPMVAVVNGTTADLSQVLKDGDMVRLIPQIAGGLF
jgi:molybdopterin converting factor small subunit